VSQKSHKNANDSLITGGVNDLPEGWKWVKLGEVMESVRNGYSKKPDDNGQKKILRISSVRPNSVDLTDVRFLETTIGSENEIREDDLLFTRYNGSRDYVGVCGRVPNLKETIYYPDKLIRCRPIAKDKLHSLYLQYASNYGEARKYVLSRIKTTAGQTGIAGSEIKQIPIPLAPVQEQTAVVEAIESRLSVADKLEETISQSLQQAEALRQSILKRAFEGRLVN
jgi:type I restriction enzyme S subunit